MKKQERVIGNKYIKTLWKEIVEIPMDIITKTIKQPWKHFCVGTPMYDIWEWFEETHNIEITVEMMDMYNDIQQKMYEQANIWYVVVECEDNKKDIVARELTYDEALKIHSDLKKQ